MQDPAQDLCNDVLVTEMNERPIPGSSGGFPNVRIWVLLAGRSASIVPAT